MIVSGSENGDSKVAPTIPSEDSVADPQNPPPYSPRSELPHTGDLTDLPQPPPSSSFGEFNSVPPADLPPPCNHLLQRRSNESIKGVWHVDTAMVISAALLVGVEEFDGEWNESDEKTRKERKKLEKKGKLPSEDPLASSATSKIRPNLMVQSKNGSISANVHVVSSDGAVRPALIVAEGHNGAVTLEVRTYAPQPLRIFARSHNGAVRVRIPRTFEGAVVAHTKNGSVKFSEPVKSRMTTFSVADTTRGYIGNWQSAGFGSTPNTTNPNADPALPSSEDHFATWTGPLVHIHSHNGAVQLSFCEEDTQTKEGGGFSSTLKGFMAGLFGGEAGQRTARGEGSSGRGGPGQGGSWECGPSSPGWGGGRIGGSRTGEGPSDEKIPVKEATRGGDDTEKDAFGFPKDRKEPLTM